MFSEKSLDEIEIVSGGDVDSITPNTVTVHCCDSATKSIDVEDSESVSCSVETPLGELSLTITRRSSHKAKTPEGVLPKNSFLLKYPDLKIVEFMAAT